MASIENENNVKVEEVCRTCLTDDGHFFNISDIFDHYTLTQMIQNITNLQMNPLDGYTQSICFECVKELRNANNFRMKCLESNDTLIKLGTKTLEVAVNVCEAELHGVDDIKKELEVNCDIADYYLETEDDCKSEGPDDESDFDNNVDICRETKEKHDKKPKKTYMNSRSIIFDCPLCHGLFSSDNIYEKHINDVHPDRLEDECFKQKREPLGYIVKKKYLSQIKCMYKCALDNFLGKTFLEFRNHRKEHAGEKPVICVECGFRTKTISLLKTHRLQKHVEEKKFSCTLCNYACQTQKALRSHSAMHTMEKNYQCKLCPMSFKFQSGLSVHKKEKHEHRKPHVCSVCQKAFFHTKGLRDHMRSHTGERPFVCHYCGKRFATATSAKTHEALRHEPLTTVFKCDICDYSTKRKAELKLHIMRHRGEKPFKCHLCTMGFLKKHALTEHIMTHSEERNFACDLCDYKAKTKNVLKEHKRTHTGERPFSCTICSYSGRTRQSLKSHIETHSPEKIFKCPNCPYRTNVRDILTRHLRRNCVILKRGRRPSKLPNIPDNISMNDEIKEDSEECFDILSSNIRC